jgi:hypothetical protein
MLSLALDIRKSARPTQLSRYSLLLWLQCPIGLKSGANCFFPTNKLLSEVAHACEGEKIAALVYETR